MIQVSFSRIANAFQCHSLLSGHYDCYVLMFSIVKNVKNITTSLGLEVFSKCICHCFCLCCCIFLVRSCFLISLINVLMVKGLKDRYLKVWCSLYVFVIVIVSVFVFVMFFVDQVMFSHDPYQLFMLCN